MKPRSSLIAFVMAFTALLSAAAVPQGMMAEWGSNGFSIKLCSPFVNDSITVSRSSGNFETLRLIERAKRIANGQDIPPFEHEPETQMQDCTFAGVGIAAFPLPNILQMTITNRQQLAGQSMNLPLAVAQRIFLPPATGPPSLL